MPPISPGRPRILKPEPSNIRGKCVSCNKNKQARFKQSGKTRYRAYCQGCNNKKYKIKQAYTKKQLQGYAYAQRLRKYGITAEQHQQMMTDQSLQCAICQKPEIEEGRKFAIDHCHDTGKVRGLLCWHCNTAIGKLEDSPERLRRAASYLEGNL